jgi:hypothetical protein
MKEKDFNYFSEKKSLQEKKNNEIKAEVDKLTNGINELNGQLTQCLDEGNLEKYKELNKRKSEAKDDLEALTLYHKRITEVNHRPYEACEVKESWDKICTELNKKSKVEYENLMKIREKYIESVEKFSKINSESNEVAKKWVSLLSSTDKAAVCGPYSEWMPGLTDYNKMNQSVTVSYGEVINK